MHVQVQQTTKTQNQMSHVFIRILRKMNAIVSLPNLYKKKRVVSIPHITWYLRPINRIRYVVCENRYLRITSISYLCKITRYRWLYIYEILYVDFEHSSRTYFGYILVKKNCSVIMYEISKHYKDDMFF